MPIPRLNFLRTTPRMGWFLAIVILGLLGLTMVEWDDWGFGSRHEDRVALAQVPPPVRATIEQEAKGGSLKDIERSTLDGKTAYTASVLIHGKEQETRIGEDGKVIDRREGEKDDD